MNELNEHFETLGVSPGATNKELKEAWRQKCKDTHPDRGGDPEEFKKVMHAYKMLTDPNYQHTVRVKEQGMSQALATNLQLPVDFATAFFGRSVTTSYNRIVLEKDTRKPLKQEEEEIVVVTIHLPAGAIFQGYQHIEENGGMKCEEEIGKAYISFLPVAHPKFRIQEANVMATEHIPLDIMLTGGNIEVETMYGIKTAKVPPASKPGDTVTIHACGLMQMGDHIVTLEPIYPDKDGLKKEEWKGLKINWEVEEEYKQDVEFEEWFARMTKETKND